MNQTELNVDEDVRDTVANPTIGIVGLGLIGGSFARAYAAAGWPVRAWDVDADTLAIARIDVLAGFLRTHDDLAACDLIILAAYPDACLDWLHSHAEELGELARCGKALWLSTPLV